MLAKTVFINVSSKRLEDSRYWAVSNGQMCCIPDCFFEFTVFISVS